jgi:long-chain acyl-CoA synthetase
VFEEVGKMVPDAEIYDVGSAKHKVQLERHQAVNRAIARFVGDDEKRSWRDSDPINEMASRRPWLSNYSKEAPWTIPVPRQPLHKFLEGAADWVPKNTAIIFYGTKITYQHLEEQVNQFAHALHGLGVRPGDRVMIVLPNVPQMVIAYYATLKIGGVVVLPNPDANAAQIQQQILHTEAKVLVTLSAFNVSKLAGDMSDESPLKSVVFAELREAVSDSVYKQLLSRWGEALVTEQSASQIREMGHRMSDLMVDPVEAPPHVDVSDEDLAAIVYTSGTTDEPKGVCLTHGNLVVNALQTRHWIPDLQYGGEIFLSVLPFMHSYGMTGAMNVPIAMGATMVLLPVFELEQVLEHIKRYKPTIFPGVPAMYTAINQAKNVRQYGLSSIKACISGASPLPVEVQEAFEKLTRGRLVEGYGLTEASPVTHSNPLYGVRKVGSIGIPIPNTDAKIVDLMTGVDLPAGQIGELVVKGPQVMQGYWRDDAEDSESVLKDGWLYTGDVAVMDTDGYFKIISRKRDTIMSGEYSVYPRDVEEVLYENSKVMEAAVVGVTSGNGGEKVKAFVVPRPGTTLSKEELLELCKRRLDDYAVPWEIEFREELPKSFIGKVLRRMLVEEKVG